MADFPTLKPAFTMQVLIDPPVNVGSTAKNCNFVVTPMVGGTVKSEPGFLPAFNGQLASNGNDYIRTDPDGKRLRLDAHTVVKTDTGAVNRNLSQSGDADHAALENGIFVASGRFIYEKGQKPIVDYKVSQVCKG
ncbi:hypothetical protein A7C99_1510 [Trichophyton rubrum]|uniref:Uncharacterized protein n=1 Tax=Trichophyton rubrum TaxID=5551 RepID=A0A178F523_TRIRU|nr:hypothetical protein A7C99_1510 [Trichophyton rubrum]